MDGYDDRPDDIAEMILFSKSAFGFGLGLELVVDWRVEVCEGSSC